MGSPRYAVSFTYGGGLGGYRARRSLKGSDVEKNPDLRTRA